MTLKGQETPAKKGVLFVCKKKKNHFSTSDLTNFVITTPQLCTSCALCRLWLFFFFGQKTRNFVAFFFSSPVTSRPFLCLFNTVTDYVALVSIKFQHCVRKKRKKEKGLMRFSVGSHVHIPNPFVYIITWLSTSFMWCVCMTSLFLSLSVVLVPRVSLISVMSCHVFCFVGSVVSSCLYGANSRQRSALFGYFFLPTIQFGV